MDFLITKELNRYTIYRDDLELLNFRLFILKNRLRFLTIPDDLYGQLECAKDKVPIYNKYIYSRIHFKYNRVPGIGSIKLQKIQIIKKNECELLRQAGKFNKKLKNQNKMVLKCNAGVINIKLEDDKIMEDWKKELETDKNYVNKYFDKRDVVDQIIKTNMIFLKKNNFTIVKDIALDYCEEILSFSPLSYYDLITIKSLRELGMPIENAIFKEDEPQKSLIDELFSLFKKEDSSDFLLTTKTDVDYNVLRQITEKINRIRVKNQEINNKTNEYTLRISQLTEKRNELNNSILNLEESIQRCDYKIKNQENRIKGHKKRLKEARGQNRKDIKNEIKSTSQNISALKEIKRNQQKDLKDFEKEQNEIEKKIKKDFTSRRDRKRDRKTGKFLKQEQKPNTFQKPNIFQKPNELPKEDLSTNLIKLPREDEQDLSNQIEDISKRFKTIEQDSTIEDIPSDNEEDDNIIDF